ncbi:hypothetical protein FGIG_11489 [Fasciola gigantica]|uniref:Uncharacterized protein n=1 Tax=Fasciola gigantica TaxID=46835 RepID=A0A504YMQ1_FASGI|nr:hypothetical protein FGIG_11489 [Fasciola gigantica]
MLVSSTLDRFTIQLGRAEEKRRGHLLTCPNMRAAGTEVTLSPPSDTLTQALIRLMERTGKTKVRYSNNGSNSKREQAELIAGPLDVSQNKHFSPPGTSHWEEFFKRLTRSVRITLRASAPSGREREETLQIILVEFGRIISGLPLLPLKVDAKDLGVLKLDKFFL